MDDNLYLTVKYRKVLQEHKGIQISYWLIRMYSSIYQNATQDLLHNKKKVITN